MGRMIQMATLTPREDLCLLTAVYNNPNSDWDVISQYILNNYLELIPPQICEERYSTFLCRVSPLTDLINLIPDNSKNYNYLREDKVPENFVYHYAEFKRKMAAADNSCDRAIINYEKRILKKALYGQKEAKTKKIRKEVFSEHEKEKMIEEIYNILKEGKRGTLSKRQVDEGLQQLLSSVIDQCNNILKIKEEQISNPSNVMRLIRSNNLIDQRREIIQIFLTAKPINPETAQVIAGKFRYVLTVYGYGQLRHEEAGQMQAQSQQQPTIEVNPLQSTFICQKSTQCGNKCLQKSQKDQITELQQPTSSPDHFSNLYCNKNREDNVSPSPQKSNTINNIFQSQAQPEIFQKPRPKLGFSSMQITICKNEVKIMKDEKPVEEIKIEAKQQMAQYVKQQVEAEGGKKTYRMVRKDNPKIPRNGRTVLTIKD